jgi:hypothetical protein
MLLLEQEKAVARRKPDSVRLQGIVSHRVIKDLREKKFLSESDAFDKRAIWQALIRAAIVGIKVTDA